MSTIRVLHITPWFPHDDDPSRTIYIQRHIRALAPFAGHHILHVDMDNRLYSDQSSAEITIAKVEPLFNFWRWKEWAFYRRLKTELIRLDAANQFTHVLFHVAYPSLVYFDRLAHLLPRKMAIIEHWSIYHFNFHSLSKPHRLSAIFHHGIPILAVSDALRKDLWTFSGSKLPVALLPNLVDEEIFFHQRGLSGNHYFMAALWKEPKDPFSLLKAITHLRSTNKNLQIRIAGEGPLLPTMQQFVEEHQLGDQIHFMGRLSPFRIAEELNNARGLLMPTQYETFSVITAEALACGCPVLADDVGALPELIDEQNGLLRSSVESWADAIVRFEARSFNREEIASSAKLKFGSEAIGQRLFRFLQEL